MATEPARKIPADNLDIMVYPDRDSMGAAAAKAAAGIMKSILEKQAGARVVFASAPSQNEFLDHLLKEEGIAWERVTAFHMDEYIGIDPDAEQSFGRFLKDRLFSKIPLREVSYINPRAADAEAEARRYAALIDAAPIDLICCGIGENGHIAFNDPPVADFEDPVSVKTVELDDVCRQQQVNDGCFPTFDDVPPTALTLTVPAFSNAAHIVGIVPGPTKSNALYETALGPISTACPASILRRHPDATFFVDTDAASRIP